MLKEGEKAQACFVGDWRGVCVPVNVADSWAMVSVRPGTEEGPRENSAEQQSFESCPRSPTWCEKSKGLRLGYIWAHLLESNFHRNDL